MKRLRKILSFLLQLTLMLVLPFVLLIRGATWLYESYHWNHWLALLTSLGAVFLVLLIYVVMLYDSIIGAGKVTRTSLKVKSFVVFAVLAAFVGYSMINLSGANAKTEAVKKEYTSLHPFMRLAVGTFVLADQGLLVTDMSRVQEDYKKMGLKTIKNSLHYEQSTGYVHAMDLRTNGRSELRNTLTQWYFRIMGFNTLRHGGTGDHLHISLSVHDKPGVI
ncbi:MAG: hypothetical protein AAF927_08215 [Bacteroidota bacterium]